MSLVKSNPQIRSTPQEFQNQNENKKISSTMNPISKLPFDMKSKTDILNNWDFDNNNNLENSSKEKSSTLGCANELYCKNNEKQKLEAKKINSQNLEEEIDEESVDHSDTSEYFSQKSFDQKLMLTNFDAMSCGSRKPSYSSIHLENCEQEQIKSKRDRENIISKSSNILAVKNKFEHCLKETLNGNFLPEENTIGEISKNHVSCSVNTSKNSHQNNNCEMHIHLNDSFKNQKIMDLSSFSNEEIKNQFSKNTTEQNNGILTKNDTKQSIEPKLKSQKLKKQKNESNIGTIFQSNIGFEKNILSSKLKSPIENNANTQNNGFNDQFLINLNNVDDGIQTGSNQEIPKYSKTSQNTLFNNLDKQKKIEDKSENIDNICTNNENIIDPYIADKAKIPKNNEKIDDSLVGFTDSIPGEPNNLENQVLKNEPSAYGATNIEISKNQLDQFVPTDSSKKINPQYLYNQVIIIDIDKSNQVNKDNKPEKCETSTQNKPEFRNEKVCMPEKSITSNKINTHKTFKDNGENELKIQNEFENIEFKASASNTPRENTEKCIDVARSKPYIQGENNKLQKTDRNQKLYVDLSKITSSNQVTPILASHSDRKFKIENTTSVYTTKSQLPTERSLEDEENQPYSVYSRKSFKNDSNCSSSILKGSVEGSSTFVNTLSTLSSNIKVDSCISPQVFTIINNNEKMINNCRLSRLPEIQATKQYEKRRNDIMNDIKKLSKNKYANAVLLKKKVSSHEQIFKPALKKNKENQPTKSMPIHSPEKNQFPNITSILANSGSLLNINTTNKHIDPEALQSKPKFQEEQAKINSVSSKSNKFSIGAFQQSQEKNKILDSNQYSINENQTESSDLIHKFDPYSSINSQDKEKSDFHEFNLDLDLGSNGLNDEYIVGKFSETIKLKKQKILEQIKKIDQQLKEELEINHEKLNAVNNIDFRMNDDIFINGELPKKSLYICKEYEVLSRNSSLTGSKKHDDKIRSNINNSNLKQTPQNKNNHNNKKFVTTEFGSIINSAREGSTSKIKSGQNSSHIKTENTSDNEKIQTPINQRYNFSRDQETHSYTGSYNNTANNSLKKLQPSLNSSERLQSFSSIDHAISKSKTFIMQNTSTEYAKDLKLSQNKDSIIQNISPKQINASQKNEGSARKKDKNINNSQTSSSKPKNELDILSESKRDQNSLSKESRNQSSGGNYSNKKLENFFLPKPIWKQERLEEIPSHSGYLDMKNLLYLRSNSMNNVYNIKEQIRSQIPSYAKLAAIARNYTSETQLSPTIANHITESNDQRIQSESESESESESFERFFNKNQEWNAKKMKWIEEMCKENYQKEMKDCTFQPKISSSSSPTKFNSKKFYERNIKWFEKIKLNNQIKQKENLKNLHKPLSRSKSPGKSLNFPHPRSETSALTENGYKNIFDTHQHKKKIANIKFHKEKSSNLHLTLQKNTDDPPNKKDINQGFDLFNSLASFIQSNSNSDNKIYGKEKAKGSLLSLSTLKNTKEVYCEDLPNNQDNFSNNSQRISDLASKYGFGEEIDQYIKKNIQSVNLSSNNTEKYNNEVKSVAQNINLENEKKLLKEKNLLTKNSKFSGLFELGINPTNIRDKKNDQLDIQNLLKISENITKKFEAHFKP